MEQEWAKRREKITDVLEDVSKEFLTIDNLSTEERKNYNTLIRVLLKAIEENTDLKIDATACLQLGAKNKNGYRFVLYPDWRDHYKVFEHVRATWQYDYFDSKKNPKEAPVLELPETLSLT